jgi:dipeptidyl aminopeptidase/acylaminoacyl peptidase
MLVLAFLFAAPAEDLAARLRHLESMAAAWAPAPSSDGARVAFITTLFGTRQAASIAVEGGFPMQLTDEPGGIAEVRYVPSEPRQLLIVSLRDGRRRLQLIDEEGSPPAAVDPASGDQLAGGFSRDGKKLFYAVRDGPSAVLRVFAMDSKKVADVVPPPPAAGTQRTSGALTLDDALSGLVSLGPLSPDSRTIAAVVRRSGADAVVLADLQSARADLLTDPQKPGRFRQPRFSPDGRTLYVLTDGGRGRFGVDAITIQDRSRRTVYAPENPVDAFAISEDGHRLAVALDSNGLSVFSLMDLPSMRVQPLAAPPAGAIADGMTWDRAGERLWFGWRLTDDATDVWQIRLGRGTATRQTRSPRPALPREAIPRPAPVQVGDRQGWLWRPAGEGKSRVAVLLSSASIRPLFDKRIAALNFGGLAVLGVSGPGADSAALAYLQKARDLDAREPLLLDWDGVPVEDAARWSGVVAGPGERQGSFELDPDHPDLRALVRYARRTTSP